MAFAITITSAFFDKALRTLKKTVANEIISVIKTVNSSFILIIGSIGCNSTARRLFVQLNSQ